MIYGGLTQVTVYLGRLQFCINSQLAGFIMSVYTHIFVNLTLKNIEKLPLEKQWNTDISFIILLQEKPYLRTSFIAKKSFFFFFLNDNLLLLLTGMEILVTSYITLLHFSIGI